MLTRFFRRLKKFLRKAVKPGNLPLRTQAQKADPPTPWMTIFEDDLKADWSEKNPGDNPKITEAFKLCGYRRMPDETPWCGVYVGSVLKRAGFEIPVGCAWARNYSARDYGIKLADPVFGCIVNVERDGAGGSSHVGFLLAWNDYWLRIGGGNQYDDVTDSYVIERKKVLSYTLPTRPE